MNVRKVNAWIAMAAIGLLSFVAVADAKVVYVAKTGADTRDGLSWATAKATVEIGLATAQSGDQVWVATGKYVERIILKNGVGLYGGFVGSETALGQRNWKANPTVLDGNQLGSVVTASSEVTATARIDGFTIRNGNAAGVGGGIYCTGSSPVIANNTITENTAGTYGGGISCWSSSSVITGNTIVANTASSAGAGIYCSGGSPTIANNTITINKTLKTEASYGGGGIYCSGGSPKITNNTITGNASFYGGGIYCYYSPAAITNTIVAFNSSGIYSPSSSVPSLRSNCVYGNVAYNYSGVANPAGANGNLSVDPQLLAADFGEVHLKASSPCIDAGDDTAVQPGWVDMDGEPRIQGAHVDIGADEFNGTQPPFAPSVVRVSPSGDDSHDGSSWGLAKRTVQAAIDAIAGAGGGDVWVAAGTYTERISLKRSVHVYGGFAGTETSRDQRDWTTHVTILDGNAEGSVVSALVGSDLSAVDGFTIRNGSSGNGGGIYCFRASPTISNNTITGNSATAIDASGGGVYCSGGFPTIAHNTIMGNSSSSSGGGISCSYSSSLIAHNTITGNSAGSSGGGVYSIGGSPMIAGNRVAANSASVVGGGVYCSEGSATIANNWITGNNLTSASSQGGGICSYYSSPMIANNTVTGNSSNNGGGIYWQSSSPTITNTIVAFNSSGLYQSGSAKVNLRYNCVYGNAAGNYSGWSGLTDPTGTNGNISADPQLLAVDSGEVHLKANSPCLDAADDAVVQADWVDMDGEPRIQGMHVDIGADEFNGIQPPIPARIIVRVSSFVGSDDHDGSSWELAKRTVQAAINATAGPDGGEVWVAAGAYTERITLGIFFHVYGGFAGTETSRDQRDRLAHATILNGSAGGSVVSMAFASDLSILDGFTIFNGKSSSGGGIYSSTGSPTISNNTITGNTATSTGAGIYCSTGLPTIINNTITGNRAYSGGGVYCSYASATIANNVVSGNTASYSAGIGCSYSSATISNNVITGNIVLGDGNGGGIVCSVGSPTITNNRIAGNSAYNGGGICLDSSPAMIANNTIVANSAYNGGGVSCRFSSPTITNNTITGNFARAGGGIYSSYSSPSIANTIVAFNTSGICQASTGTPSLRGNCVYGNSAYNFLGLTEPTGASGNISADPKLADVAYGNMHIQPDSPCVDAGDDAAVQSGWPDIDGQSRISGGRVDIGADESAGTVWPEGPYGVVRVSPNGKDAFDGSSWALAKRTVQAAIDAASILGGEVWVQAGTYEERITLSPFVYLYGGFSGQETARNERDSVANVTILDGRQGGSVVTVQAGGQTGAIDGFTIRNGRSTYGGGIACSYSSLAISNNTIIANTVYGLERLRRRNLLFQWLPDDFQATQSWPTARRTPAAESTVPRVLRRSPTT